MSDEICIRITRVSGGSGRLAVTASLSKPHASRRGIKMVPLTTRTARMASPYVTELTPGLLAAMWDAIRAVAAGYYDNQELPWG